MGVPGFDLTFCAPKSVSRLWGFGNENGIRKIVNQAHHDAVSQALDYLSDHAGYTRRQANDRQGTRMFIERFAGISGVKYEHHTSRAGPAQPNPYAITRNVIINSIS